MIPQYQIDGVRALKRYAEIRQEKPQWEASKLSRTMDANLFMIYGFLEDVMTNMNILERAMEKSATKEEFRQAKNELKRVIKEAGKPSREEIAKHKRIEKHARHVYG
jgi:preprotein translocase subunit Sss1